MQLAVRNVLGAVFDGQNDENGSASNAQITQITKMPLVLPVEASIFALFLIVLLGAFYVVSILPLIFSFFFKFSHRKKTKIPLKIKFTELS